MSMCYSCLTSQVGAKRYNTAALGKDDAGVGIYGRPQLISDHRGSGTAPTDTRSGAIVYGANATNVRSLSLPWSAGESLAAPARHAGSTPHSSRAIVTASLHVQPPAPTGRTVACRAKRAATPRYLGFSASRSSSLFARDRRRSGLIDKCGPNRTPCGATERPDSAAKFHRSMERRARIV